MIWPKVKTLSLQASQQLVMSIKKVRGSQEDLLRKVIKNPVNEQISITRTWPLFDLFEAEKTS